MAVAPAPASTTATGAPEEAAAERPRGAWLRHAAYVFGENPLTLVSLCVFAAIALLGLVGPFIAPYDPLASDTSAALQAPSHAHCRSRWRSWPRGLVGRRLDTRPVAAMTRSRGRQ